MKKVLICDDSLLIRRQLKEFFSNNWENVLVLESVNGKEAVTRYELERPCLVFMDIVMPEMDGISSVKEIRKMDPEAKVIVLTSVGNREMLKKALEAGAMDFIQKPWTVETMNKIMENYS